MRSWCTIGRFRLRMAPSATCQDLPMKPAAWLLVRREGSRALRLRRDDLLARYVAATAARERLSVDRYLVRLGDEEDDLPRGVEPQAHRDARLGGEPAPDDLDAPALVPAGSELVANERAGLLLP